MNTEWFHGAQEVDYEDADGRRVTRFFSVGEIPSEIGLDGRTFERVHARRMAPVMPIEGVTKGFDRHFVSRTCPKWDPSAPRHDMDKSSPTYGQPQFSNRREINEYMDKANHRAYETGIGNVMSYGEKIEAEPEEKKRDRSAFAID